MIDEKKLTKEMKNRRDFWFSEASKYAEIKDKMNTDICDGKAMELEVAMNMIKEQPKIDKWIPCSERLPDDLKTVTVTWVNRAPMRCYEGIKDKPFTAPAMRFKGNWYWWSTTLKDYLVEYGEWKIDLVDNAIEITAWQPLPEPWGGEEK